MKSEKTILRLFNGFRVARYERTRKNTEWVEHYFVLERPTRLGWTDTAEYRLILPDCAPFNSRAQMKEVLQTWAIVSALKQLPKREGVKY